MTAVRGRGWARFLIGFTLLWGTLALLSGFDSTGRWGIPILVAVVMVAVLVERVIFRTGWRESIARLGLGRPG